MIINVQEVIKKAKEYLFLIYDNPENILLEEVHMSEEAPIWIVTLRFDNPLPLKPIEIAVGKNRIFRTIRINAKTGEVYSMKTFQI